MTADGGSVSALHARYRFADVTVDVAAHTLERAGVPHTLEPKAFAVLRVLLEHAGELVARDVLLDEVWGHRHVTPGVLTRAIAQLRHALGDDPHRPRFIHTQHAMGYRFIAPLEMDPVQGHAVLVPEVRAPEPASALAPPRVTPPPSASPLPGAALTPRQPARLRRWLGGLFALGVLGVALALLWPRLQPGPAPQADATVAVLPFTVAGRDGERYFAEGLATELRDALAGVPGLRVVTHSPGLRPGEDAREAAARLKVARVLDARVRHEGAQLRIDARLLDGRDGATLWLGSYERDDRDVFALQTQIAGEVVQALLGRLPEGARALQRRLSPTQSLAAYDAYLRGLQLLQAPGNEADLRRAIAQFRRALAADPRFARAQAGICRAEIARFEDARDSPAFQRAQAACGRASGMDPELREVSLALGEMYRARGEPRVAIAHYTRALTDAGLRASALVGLARAQGELGRASLARGYFEQARRLQPSDPAVFRELGYFEYTQGNLPKAIDAYRTATELSPEDERLWSSLGGLYLAAGQDAGAAQAFERSLAVRPSYAALSNYGSLKYGQRRYAQAAALYRQAAGLDGSDFRLWGNLGDALSALDTRSTEAREAYTRAAQLAADYARIRPADAAALAMQAWYRANLGQAAPARTLLGQAARAGSEPGETAFWAAQTHALLGDAELARQQLAAARRGGVAGDRLQAAPALRPVLLRETAVARVP